MSDMTKNVNEPHPHVCPVWVGFFLASPLRALIQNPREMLAPHVSEGMHALDVGPGMGFFTLPLARLVGPSGRVVCVDLQERMIASLNRRAQRAGLGDRIEARVCGAESLRVDDLAHEIDFVLLFAVVHETGDAARLFREVKSALKPRGRILFVEPKGHVSGLDFDDSLAIAEECGLRSTLPLKIRRSHAAILEDAS